MVKEEGGLSISSSKSITLVRHAFTTAYYSQMDLTRGAEALVGQQKQCSHVAAQAQR